MVEIRATDPGSWVSVARGPNTLVNLTVANGSGEHTVRISKAQFEALVAAGKEMFR